MVSRLQRQRLRGDWRWGASQGRIKPGGRTTGIRCAYRKRAIHDRVRLSLRGKERPVSSTQIQPFIYIIS